MPKAAPRRKKIRSARNAAAPVPESAGPEKQDKVLPVLAKLNAPGLTDRIWSTSAVSYLLASSDASVRRVLQSKNVVGLLIERLLDTELEVRAEACGALRNLAVNGGHEVCAEMYNKQILPSLSKNLEAVYTTAKAEIDQDAPNSDKEKRARKMLWQWTENLLTIYWSLAETSEKALKATLAEPQLLPFLFNLLQNAQATLKKSNEAIIPNDVLVSAAQLLYVLSDSEHFTTNIKLTPAFRSTLLALVSSPSNEKRNIIKPLAAGILQSLAPSHKQRDDEFDSVALNSLSALLDSADLQTDAKTSIEAHVAIQAQPAQKKDIIEVTPYVPTDAENALSSIEIRLATVRLTLEVLADLVSSLDGIMDVEPEYEEWSGVADVEMDTDEVNGDDEDMDGDVSNIPTEPIQDQAALSNTTLEIFAKLPSVLIKLATPTQISFSSSNSTNGVISTQTGAVNAPPTVIDSITSINVRALECLNNLLITLARCAVPVSAPADEEGGMAEPEVNEQNLSALEEFVSSNLKSLQSLWQFLFEVLLQLCNNYEASEEEEPSKKKAKQKDDESPYVLAIEAATGSIWALARAASASLTVGDNEHRLLLQILARADFSEDIRVRAIGALGILASNPTVSVDENKSISAQLLAQLSATSTAPTQVQVSALDTLIDIYSDETMPWDVVFREGDYLSILAGCASRIRTLSKKIDKKKDPEGRAAAEGALANLIAFVKYRRNLVF